MDEAERFGTQRAALVGLGSGIAGGLAAVLVSPESLLLTGTIVVCVGLAASVGLTRGWQWCRRRLTSSRR